MPPLYNNHNNNNTVTIRHKTPDDHHKAPERTDLKNQAHLHNPNTDDTEKNPNPKNQIQERNREDLSYQV